MKHPKMKNTHLSLTLVFALLTFCILVVSIGVSAGLLYALSWLSLFPVQAEVPELIQVLLFMSAVSLIMGTGIAMLAVRIPLSPINYLINQLDRLAEGDFGARLRFGRVAGMIPAFAGVEKSFNKMAEELDNTQVLRSDFINNFSHEFKTPIVSIAGFAKLLQRADLAQAQKKEYVDAIVEESMRLSYMATNVLNLTKVENQAILTGAEEYNLSEQLRSAVLLLESGWSGKGMELDMDFPEVNVVANEELMKEVWINLIHNAVKFSPEGGPLRIRVYPEQDSVLVTVANLGQISPESQKRIWNKFYQADRSHSSEGNGVGLAIVKRILELHKGKAEVACRDGWVVFTVTIPR